MLREKYFAVVEKYLVRLTLATDLHNNKSQTFGM